jgi:CheY-like chemotaxis protein
MKPILLIVDDNFGDRELVRYSLAEIGSDVVILEATDGDDAMDLLETRMKEKKRLPDVILLDLNLVRLSGHEALIRFKVDAALQHIPVVVYTSSQTDADISRSYQLGAACVLTKPLTFGEAKEMFRTFALFWLRSVTFEPRGKP